MEAHSVTRGLPARLERAPKGKSVWNTLCRAAFRPAILCLTALCRTALCPPCARVGSLADPRRRPAAAALERAVRLPAEQQPPLALPLPLALSLPAEPLVQGVRRLAQQLAACRAASGR